MLDILKSLNPEQKKAVTHGEGPLLVVAGAGTGKTQVITIRIAYLIATKRAKPEEILALTFTDKAATEMEERVDVLVPYGYTDFWISTFHSFGDRVLKENALELGFSPDFQVLTPPEQIILFRENLFKFPLSYYRPLGNPTRYIEAILALISRAKDEDITPEEYINYAQKLNQRAKNNPEDTELAEISTRELEVAQTYQSYQELLAQEGKVDFGDLITLTLKLFRNHPAILKRYQRRFRYILVDEFQDTNYSQFQLVKLLAKEHQNITVVGDDDQSIYKFRGAAISNILGFLDTYPKATQIVLTKNYRSPQPILDSAYRLISYNNPDRLEFKNNIDKHLIAEKKEEGVVKHLHCDSLLSEAEKVANLIKERKKEKGYSWSDFAILVRSNNDADPFLRALNMQDIPWRFSGNEGLYDREEIRLLISFLRVIANPEDSVSLYYLASSDIYEFPVKDLTLCMNCATRQNRSLFHIFSHISEISPLEEEISLESKATIDKLLKDIENYITLSTKATTGEILYNFITKSGYLKNLTSSPSLSNEEKVRNIAKFFDLIQSSSHVITHNRVPQFVSYLDLLIQAGDNPAVAEAEMDTDAVNVLTVHKAKGLEFPVVIMVSLVKMKFPSNYRKEPIPLPEDLIKDILPSGDFHLQEERRLFYVGMTRAMRELYLTSAKDYGGKREKRVSQFVLEALNLSSKKVSSHKTPALEVIERSAPKEKGKEGTYLKIPDDEVLTLSYFQVDDYLTCPLKYKYIHVLRVPILQHQAVIYGKALHDAVQYYYKVKLSGREVKEEEIIEVFENSWINEGFMSEEHERKRLEEGRKTLQSFYQRAKEERFLPTYIEKEFNFMLGKNRIVGRWDRVDIIDGDAYIIDFKSSRIENKKRADKRTKESLQLCIYALAYQRIFGKLPKKVQLHFLGTGVVGEAELKERDLNKTIQKIQQASVGIRSRSYKAKPEYMSCRWCAYQKICPYKGEKNLFLQGR
ncbi:ATP-dependent helicase [Candidatus Aerophobetes bacterium]|nr:ATP-dependent helicase [Candidatus Aerophobetes bacterium]